MEKICFFFLLLLLADSQPREQRRERAPVVKHEVPHPEEGELRQRRGPLDERRRGGVVVPLQRVFPRQGHARGFPSEGGIGIRSRTRTAAAPAAPAAPAPSGDRRRRDHLVQQRLRPAVRVRRVLAVTHLDAGQRRGRAVRREDVEQREVAVAVVDVVVARLERFL